ncbi:hypothetical protein [Bacteroides sp.]|uniref:hypothetical protein n=1 Tax=Bacteroides sp. TaxID=29523 RepID=UPI001DCE2198|nr:hypothetical protein [Bacteroides sp.]MBS6967008.1 hypothetical protein [Bacteroides sp.]
MEKKNEKKLLKIFGSYALKFLPLHPLLKMKAARVDILLKETVPGSSFFFFLPPFRQERRRGKRKERKKQWGKPWAKQENRQYLFYIGKDKLLNSSVLNR